MRIKDWSSDVCSSDLAGQLALAARALRAVAAAAIVAPRREILDRHRFALDLEVDRRHFAVALDQGEAERLTRGEALQPGLFDRADVDEDIFAAIVAGDEAEAFCRVEEFNRALALEIGKAS